ncbi:hypothetical protein ISR94_02450 [Candidatus Microgenomates bacterium]|nr:hypothetical protein [Candidatus Microgenomates bacterium]
MIKKTNLLKLLFFPFLLILVCIYLAWVNYVPGTILSGWDTLHPEFSFWEYFRRSLNGVWMQHQGLGAVASQSHPAELSRLLIVYLLNLVLPLNLVRYSFFFLCLALGVLGVYYFSEFLLSLKWKKYIKPASFLASLFYLLNLTTVQQFFVPLEMFAVHYATLPWLFLFASKYIKQGGRKTLIWFGVVSLFASSMAHTATLFYAYLLCLGLFTVILNFRRSVVLIGLTILVNSFWLLPNLYFIKNHSQEVSSSKIHTVFTGEAFLQSESYGNFNDLALSKNFLFNWTNFDFSMGEFTDLLSVWKDHLSKPYVEQIGYVLFGLALLGIIVSVFTKSWYSLALVPSFLLAVFFWINSNYPIELVFDHLRNNINLLKEGLRFPFTKFSIILVMILSVWFSYSSMFILKVFGRIKLGFIYLLIVVGGMVYFQLPQFKGYLISPSMKVNIPNEYFQAFDWFEDQDESGRVASLPLNTYWGWQYNDWGYQGAGFSWFDIKQPILEREFDRWSMYNESFYNQASVSLYGNKPEIFEKVLQKYQVRYLLLDESIINPGGDQEILRISEIKDVLFQLGFQEVFKQGFLTVYDTQSVANFDTGITTDSFISTLNDYTLVNADLVYSGSDSVFLEHGNYAQDESGIGYPFVNFDPRGPVTIELKNSQLEFQNTTTNSTATLAVSEKLEETFEKEHGFEEPKNCDLKEKGDVEREQLEVGRRYKAQNSGVSCDYFIFSDLDKNLGYVLHIKGKNTKGRSLKVYMYGWETKRVELEELLVEGEFDSYFVIRPSSDSYTINLETRSFGKVLSENTVNTLELIPFDIDLLTNLYIDPTSEIFKTNNLEVVNVKKYGTSIYKIQTKGEGLLQLGQGYEDGWLGLTKTGSGLSKLEHVKVNSWSNGFMVPDGSDVVYIIFWPQLLQWGGFVLLLCGFWFLGRKFNGLSD